MDHTHTTTPSTPHMPVVAPTSTEPSLYAKVAAGAKTHKKKVIAGVLIGVAAAGYAVYRWIADGSSTSSDSSSLQ